MGSKGTDAILAGRIYASTAGNTVGLVKEGAGTYTISGNDNDISGGIRLTEGRLNIDNDADEAEKKKKNGATGKNGTVFVFNGTTLAGNGNVAARTEIYGTVRPGGEKPGTLHFADYTSTTGVNVTLHPEANIVCRVKTTDEHDMADIKGVMAYSNKTQDFEDLSLIHISEPTRP